MEILLSIRSTLDGTVREVERAIGDGLVIGRGAEEGILLDGPDLSREHLVLTNEGNGIFVADLSSNGTWVNGARLRKMVKTRVGTEDSIELPGYVLQVRPAHEPEESDQPAVVQMPAPRLQEIAPPEPAPVPRGNLADPVFRFIGSFTFGEKFLVLVGLVGLALLYSYFGS